jgi:ATP-dependent RNA helicase DeaD
VVSMLRDDLVAILGPELSGALNQRGFESLTPVQEAVLTKDAETHDLRISSQTGSGKTVAIGIALRYFLNEKSPAVNGAAHPRAIVVTPTRELAKQVQEELAWLYAPLGARVISVTGGGGYRDELRSFMQGPRVIVGTPGRLVDHLQRKSIDPSNVVAAVLDEADRMLDLGFREDIETILAAFPPHRTHLVSATFPREVRTLADRVQKNVVTVEGTPIGRANADIEHVVHLVHVPEKLDAIINLLLENPGAQTLIFSRTRADVATMTTRLREAGFKMDSLSGEMEQRERNRALAAFKRGDLDAMVATDVAARGIDVVDIAQVIHADPPEDADSYTHRSGRTGRAGRKGKSAVLVAPNALKRTQMLLRRAGVQFSIQPIPSADVIRAREDESIARELVSEETSAFAEPDARARALAATLVKADRAEEAVARLVMKIREKHAEPRDVTALEPRLESNDRDRDRGRERGVDRSPSHDARKQDARAPFDRSTRSAPREDRGARRSPVGGGGDKTYVTFRVSWGALQGADARRLLAMVCRRGEIGSTSVGAIRVAESYAVVDVTDDVAESFATKVSVPDPRDPRVEIKKWESTPRDRERRERPQANEKHANDKPRPTDLPKPRESRPRSQETTRDRRPPPKSHEPRKFGPKHPPDRSHRAREMPRDASDKSRVVADRPSKKSHDASKAPPRKNEGGHAPPKRSQKR